MRSTNGETYVMDGIQPRARTKNRMMIIPSQKAGIDSPASDSTRST